VLRFRDGGPASVFLPFASLARVSRRGSEGMATLPIHTPTVTADERDLPNGHAPGGSCYPEALTTSIKVEEIIQLQSARRAFSTKPTQSQCAIA